MSSFMFTGSCLKPIHGNFTNLCLSPDLSSVSEKFIKQCSIHLKHTSKSIYLQTKSCSSSSNLVLLWYSFIPVNGITSHSVLQLKSGSHFYYFSLLHHIYLVYYLVLSRLSHTPLQYVPPISITLICVMIISVWSNVIVSSYLDIYYCLLLIHPCNCQSNLFKPEI